MFHELRDTRLSSLAALEPSDLPFRNPLALHGNEMAILRFVDPLKLADQHQSLVLHQVLFLRTRLPVRTAGSYWANATK
jgi:hypothetical protein